MASTFSIEAQPDTDIWKKAPAHDVFNAPYKPLSTNPLPKFLSASITFSALYTTQFDQAGILLKFTRPSSPSTPRKWIKAGIELFNGAPASPPVAGASHAEEIKSGARPVTILVEKSESGSCLWVYQVDGDEKVPLREICWPFAENGGEGWELEVSAAVARPNKEVDGVLQAQFHDFDIKWA
ncbi:hypothetical protein PT974_02109 [Cladobotryum mycophilum]|uniref:Uncharacterized protein n=1 Tax=Cladobotryum mycophilum TaxID=491253 RepID=A0ABR0SX97_9HYPO